MEGVAQLRVLLEASMAQELIWDGREKISPEGTGWDKLEQNLKKEEYGNKSEAHTLRGY